MYEEHKDNFNPHFTDEDRGVRLELRHGPLTALADMEYSSYLRCHVADEGSLRRALEFLGLPASTKDAKKVADSLYFWARYTGDEGPEGTVHVGEEEVRVAWKLVEKSA